MRKERMPLCPKEKVDGMAERTLGVKEGKRGGS